MRAAGRPDELNSVGVEYRDGERFVRCFCGEWVRRSIVPHLKAKHATQWSEWTETFVRLRGLGYPLKRIMRLFRAGNGELLFSWTVIERAIRRAVEGGGSPYISPPKRAVESWQPADFALATTTVWDFPRRGAWAVHSGDYRGNWPPQIPRNLIVRYTQEGDLVVDAFAGGGTTLIEAWLLNRHSIGLDVSKMAMHTTRAKLAEMEELAVADDSVCLAPDYRPKIIEGNALKLRDVLIEQNVGLGDVKLLCAHPPYLDSIEYTTDRLDDLSLLADPEVFCKKMREFAYEAHRVLCTGGVCAVLIGDVRKHGRTTPLGFRTLESFLSVGFELDSIVVKTQHRDRSSEFYVVRNAGSLLMAHEYLFIFRNAPDNRSESKL